MNIIITRDAPIPNTEKLLEAIQKGIALSEQDAKIVSLCTKTLENLKRELEQGPNKDIALQRLITLKKSSLTSCITFIPSQNGFKVIPLGLIALAKFGWVAKEDLVELEKRIYNQFEVASNPLLSINALPAEIPLPSRGDLCADDQDLLSNLINILPDPESENFSELLKLAKSRLKEYVIISLEEPKAGHNFPSLVVRPLGYMALQSCGYLNAEDKKDLKDKTINFIEQNYSKLQIKLLNGEAEKKPVDFLQATSADNVGNFNDRFELSLEPCQPSIQIQEWTERFAVPHVGVYANEGSVYKVGERKYEYYQWSPPIVLMRLPNALIWESIPENLRKALENLGLNASTMRNHEAVQYNLNISGNPFYLTGKDGETLKSPKGYNISFHSSIFPQNSKGASSKPLVGIFEPKGVLSMDVPVNKLEEREVFLHEDASRASSPDNVTFQINAPVALFWSAGVDKGKINICAHMVFNDDKLEERVRKASSSSKNVNELLINLREVGLPKEAMEMLQNILIS